MDRWGWRLQQGAIIWSHGVQIPQSNPSCLPVANIPASGNMHVVAVYLMHPAGHVVGINGQCSLEISKHGCVDSMIAHISIIRLFWHWLPTWDYKHREDSIACHGCPKSFVELYLDLRLHFLCLRATSCTSDNFDIPATETQRRQACMR